MYETDPPRVARCGKKPQPRPAMVHGRSSSRRVRSVGRHPTRPVGPRANERRPERIGLRRRRPAGPRAAFLGVWERSRRPRSAVAAKVAAGGTKAT